MDSLRVEEPGPAVPPPPSGNRRVILHLDMDAFYASVEQRDNPEWAGNPVIVGAAPDRRGVVCAASYEARKFGVHSAMPGSTARRLCPQGIFVRPRMDVYRAESAAIMAIVREVAGDRVEQVSVDEAYIEVTPPQAEDGPYDALLERFVPVAQTIRERIRERRRLTATIGVAPNKLLAKIASSVFKPDGLTLVRDSERAAFLRPMPVGVIHGVGRVTGEALRAAGITTIADLQDTTRDLRPYVGSWAADLKRMAFGEDDRPLDTGDDVRSISSETTFGRDTDDRRILRACLREQAEELAAKLRRRRLSAATVQVKVRYGDFTTLTRRITVEGALEDGAAIYRLGCWLLGRHQLVKRPLRLLGLCVSGLREVTVRQLELPFATAQKSSGAE